MCARARARVRACVRACVCVCACVRACVCACVRARVRLCVQLYNMGRLVYIAVVNPVIYLVTNLQLKYNKIEH